MSATGIVYIKIKLYLNQDIEMDRIENFVNELDYKVEDTCGLIADTEIVDSSIYE